MGNPTVTIDIVTDARRAQAGLNDVAESTGKFDSAMKKAAVPAGIVVAGLIGIGKASEESASRLEQSRGAIEKVFGGATAAKVNQWGKDAAKNMGLSTAAYQEFAAVSGAMLQNLGFNQADAATQSDKLIQRGADLAATFGGETSTAVEAMGAALRGEYDSLEQFGIKISAASVAAEVAKQKNEGLTFASDNAATAAASLSLIMDGSAASLGAYASEADTAAGSQQTANAQWENAKAALGERLLPIFAAASTALSSLLGWVERNSGAATALATIVGGLAVSVLAYNAAAKVSAVVTGAWHAATSLATGAQWLLNAALWANPFGVVIAMVAALGAIIYTVITKIQQLKKEFAELARGDFSSQRVPIVLNGIRMPPGGRAAPPGLGLLSAEPDVGLSLMAGRGEMTAAALVDEPPLTGRSSSGLVNVQLVAAPPPAVVNINVTGALDPVAVARQISGLLRTADRRIGGIDL